MIYDCFAFFNEFDLLEIRLNELDPIVDHFVLVEATRTFTKKPKPLYFEENKQRYAKFLHKITHVIVDDYPGFFTHWRVPKVWDFDNHQKNQIKRGLMNCRPDDIIIFSDVDEIPRPEKVLEFKDKPGLKIFRQKMFYYYVNCLITDYDEPVKLQADGIKPWHGSVMIHFKNFISAEAHRAVKNTESPDFTFIENGGWHFSSLGGVQKIIQKIESYAHKEFNSPEFKDPKRLESLIKEGKDIFDRKMTSKFVSPTEDMPEYLVNNLGKFENLVLR